MVRFNLRRNKARVRALGIVALVLIHGFAAGSETVRGTVVDPQRRVIVGAKVWITCGNRNDNRETDDQGNFTFTWQAFPGNCRLRVVSPGFAAVDLSLGRVRTLTLQLRLPEVKQSAVVKDDIVPQGSLESLSLSASDLGGISPNSDDLIAYSKLLAGVYSGSDHVYVDGLPTEQLPPANRIESITINPDPFSAEYSDGSDTHIEVTTKTPERKFAFSSAGISLGPNEPNGLNPHLTSSAKSANFGLTGPIPYLPLAFTNDVSFWDRQGEIPVEAFVPTMSGLPVVPVDSAPFGNSSVLYGLGASYSRNDALRLNASLYVKTTRRSDVNVGGLTLPAAGTDQNSNGREFRATLRKITTHLIYRGGIVTDWLNAQSNANSTALGIGVSGAFTAGGAQINEENTHGTKWTLKNVLEFHNGNRNWSIGAMVSRRSDQQLIFPNSLGYIQFDNLEDYILSAKSGAPTGSGFVMRGQGQAQYVSYIAAPFVEGDIFNWTRASIRGGLRLDYQTQGRVIISPRLSAVTILHGFVMKAGFGLFSQIWPNDVFLKVIEDDGHHLQQYLLLNTSLSDMAQGIATPEPQIVSAIAPNLTPARDWVSKLSIARPFGSFLPGVEWTWTEGTHLLGSQRLSSATGWTDLLASNRGLNKQQLHFRGQYKIAGQSLTAHYEWTRARDDTDGPFSFPARQDDIAAEWGPASGISEHNVTLAANLRLWKSISLSTMESWRSPIPLNITSGDDPEGNGLYTDRAGLPRNSGRGPSFSSFNVYAHYRMPLAKLFAEMKQRTYLDLGLQGVDLLGSTNYVSVGSVMGSPSFGQPVAALPGRSFRFSLDFSH